jgi:hypothetical protein
MSGSIPPGPRGVQGAQTHKQAIVTESGTMDRREIKARKDNERTKQRVVKKKTDSEYDLLTNDLLITKARKVYRDNEDAHRVPVISTVAGLELGPNVTNLVDPTAADLAATLKGYVFAGVSMSRVVDRPEVPGRTPPQSDIPVQIHGTTTLPIYHQDAPFMAIARAVPNSKPVPTQGHLGTNHRHLVVEIDGRDASFGQRLQVACYNKYHGDIDGGGPETTPGPCQDATEECLRRMTDFLMMGYVAFMVAADLDANDGKRHVGGMIDPNYAQRIMANMKDEQFRRDFMGAMFAGLGAGNTVEKVQNKAFLANPGTPSFGPDALGDLHTKQVTASSEFFTALMDLLRIDNMWMIGKVTRAGKAPGECDVMLV